MPIKLVEIPDVICPLGSDDVGTFPVSSDYGDKHHAKERTRLKREATVSEQIDSKGLVRELTKVPKREQKETTPIMVSGVASHLASILRKEKMD